MGARKRAAEIMARFEYTIKHYAASTTNFADIVNLGKNLRDVVADAHGMEFEDREYALDLFRRAKLLVLAQSDAERKLESLERIEDDLRRIA